MDEELDAILQVEVDKLAETLLAGLGWARNPSVQLEALLRAAASRLATARQADDVRRCALEYLLCARAAGARMTLAEWESCRTRQRVTSEAEFREGLVAGLRRCGLLEEAAAVAGEGRLTALKETMMWAHALRVACVLGPARGR